MRLKDKVALITGGAQGIGAEIARRFRDEGAQVFIGDIREPEVEMEGALRGIVFLMLDVTSEESWAAALAAILARAKRLDVLVNNAGINIRKNIEDMPAEALDAMLAVNVKGPFLGIKHVLPILRASGGGCILNMSSICGLVGHKYTNEAYTTTKGAVTLLDPIYCRALRKRQCPLQFRPPEHGGYTSCPNGASGPGAAGRTIRRSSAGQARDNGGCGERFCLSCKRRGGVYQWRLLSRRRRIDDLLIMPRLGVGVA